MYRRLTGLQIQGCTCLYGNLTFSMANFFVVLRMAKADSTHIKPNFPKRLFWEYNFEKIDWKKHAEAIIDRVIERGT